jgi:hypothetical protein
MHGLKSTRRRANRRKVTETDKKRNEVYSTNAAGSFSDYKWQNLRVLGETVSKMALQRINNVRAKRPLRRAS